MSSVVSEEMEPFAQMGAHTAPPLTENTAKLRFISTFAVRACLCAHICHSLYWGMEGHPCMSLICACVSAWEAAAWLLLLTLARWQSKRSAVSTTGSHTLPAPLRRMNINNSKWSRLLLRLLPITLGWADIAAARKATNRQKAEEKNCDARLKGTPEVPAISSTAVLELYCFEKAKNPLCVHTESRLH